MTYEEKKAEEYVSRNFPNADFGYCGHTTERYKASFMAGYEQCKKDMSGWHYPSKGELPDTKEDERILFFVKDTNVYDGSPYQHFALGFYKSISYKGGKKMFSEQSKGYSCDFLPEEVIAWQYIKPPEECV